MGDFDPAGLLSAWRAAPARVGAGPGTGGPPPEATDVAPAPAEEEDALEPSSRPIAAIGGEDGDGPDDLPPTGDVEADLRAAAHRLAALPRLGEARAQARIDALATRIAAAPTLAAGLEAEIAALEETGRLDGAEGVIAALGRTDAGIPVLARVIADEGRLPRLRGAAALAFVQTKDPRRLDATRPRAEAYARASGDVEARGVERALWLAYQRLVVAAEGADVGRDRALDACVVAGLRNEFGEEFGLRLLRVGDVGTRRRVLAALGHLDTLDAAARAALRRTWRTDPERDLRRFAIGVTVTVGPDSWFWEDAVPVVTDTSVPGSRRADLLAGLALRHPIEDRDILPFERWVEALVAWSEAEPTVRDEAPTADARNGPFVTFVDVDVRARVAALVRAVDRATGERSASIHAAVERTSRVPGR